MTDKIQEILATHKNIVDEMNKKRAELAEQGKVAMKGAFKDFFEIVPEVKAVRFTAYTPYFNDGDACQYSVNDYYLFLQETDLDDEGYDSWSITNEKYNSDIKNALGDKFSDLMKALPLLNSIFNLPDDIFLDVFGDHVQVTATSDGFDIEEYSHD